MRRGTAAAFPAVVAVLAAMAAGGCGLTIQAPDLFLLKRTGGGRALTELVNDSGTIRCDGGRLHTLSAPLLLRARDLAESLDSDAKRSLRIPSPADSVSRYTMRLQDGTISFPDTAGRRHHELAQAELFAVDAAQIACGLAG